MSVWIYGCRPSADLNMAQHCSNFNEHKSRHDTGVIPTPAHQSADCIVMEVSVWSQDGTLSTVSELQAGQLRIQIPRGARDFPLLKNIDTCSRVHPAFYSRGTGIPSQG